MYLDSPGGEKKGGVGRWEGPLSLALFFLCVAVSISIVFHTFDLITCLVVAANTDSNVITCSVLCHSSWF